MSEVSTQWQSVAPEGNNAAVRRRRRRMKGSGGDQTVTECATWRQPLARVKAAVQGVAVGDVGHHRGGG
jgi:hypothetical protein